MQAMILAAGKGERMRPLTNSIPKPLLVVDGQPLLRHHLRALAAAGVKKVVVNVWYLADQIIEAVNTWDHGLDITCLREPELLNTGGGIVNALAYLGNDPFLVISADILTDFPLKSLPQQLSGLAHLVLVDNPEYHSIGDFALNAGKLNMQGAPKFTYANIGVYKHEFFANAPAGAFGLGDLLRQHITAGNITGEYYSGSWHNIGTPQDLELLNKII